MDANLEEETILFCLELHETPPRLLEDPQTLLWIPCKQSLEQALSSCRSIFNVIGSWSQKCSEHYVLDVGFPLFSLPVMYVYNAHCIVNHSEQQSRSNRLGYSLCPACLMSVEIINTGRLGGMCSFQCDSARAQKQLCVESSDLLTPAV